MISDAKYEWFEKWQDMRTHKRGDEYDQYKQKFADKLLEVLYEKVKQYHIISQSYNYNHYKFLPG